MKPYLIIEINAIFFPKNLRFKFPYQTTQSWSSGMVDKQMNE